MTTKTSADVTLVREVNQRAVLDAIAEKKVTSRTELAKILSMSKPAISDNLAHLIRQGIIAEVGQGDAKKSGGRKPIMVSFNKNHRYIIAIDLNYSNPEFVLANLDGDILRQFDIKISKATPGKDYLKILQDGISLLQTSGGIAQEQLLCIAIASPGVFNKQSQLLSYNPKFGGIPWCSMDIGSLLLKKFGLPVMMMNDINAAALGEWVNSPADIGESMLFISCGSGLGSGIIIGGKLYEGLHFNAGEIFRYTTSHHLAKGQTLEDAINKNAIVAKYQAYVNEGKSGILEKGAKVDFAVIVDAYKRKDPYIAALAEKICNELSLLALNFVGLLSIDNVVFGGEYIAFGNLFLHCFKKNAELINAEKHRVQLASQGKYAGIRGLIYRAREQYFTQICQAGAKPLTH